MLTVRKTKRTEQYSMPGDGKCPFPKCEYVCKSRKGSTYAMHISMKHKTTNGTYVCQYCDKEFTSSGNLRNHKNSIHISRQFKCLTCSRAFKTKQAALCHVMAVHYNISEPHATDNEGKCVHCGEQRPNSGNLYHLANCIGVGNMVSVGSNTGNIMRTFGVDMVDNVESNASRKMGRFCEEIELLSA